MQQSVKLACLTLDFERDYGWRTGQFNIWEQQRPQLEALGELIQRLQAPISAFITTEVLQSYPDTVPWLRQYVADYHGHSHTHNTQHFDSPYEISMMQSVFTQVFGQPALGYRAPLGVLYPGDIDVLHTEGIRFSSSVFPSLRPGKFNNLHQPTQPFCYQNGVLELPLATVPRLRWIISLSYLKLIGWQPSQALFRAFGLPPMLIFNTHLHDFIWNEASFQHLPRHYQVAWGRNKTQGMVYFEAMVGYLRRQGYQFCTMSELYQRCASSC
jgi:peptidoglycan/xylan/chitin deacetylase (PgdA/CDA1 family)